MYPNLYYAFRDLFGIEITGLRFVNSFGFFVALAFLFAAWVLTFGILFNSIIFKRGGKFTTFY